MMLIIYVHILVLYMLKIITVWIAFPFPSLDFFIFSISAIKRNNTKWYLSCSVKSNSICTFISGFRIHNSTRVRQCYTAYLWKWEGKHQICFFCYDPKASWTETITRNKLYNNNNIYSNNCILFYCERICLKTSY
jgi:hypothetical protein